MKEITRHFCAKIAAPLSLLISAVQKFRKEARQESWESIRCSFDVCLDAALEVPVQEQPTNNEKSFSMLCLLVVCLKKKKVNGMAGNRRLAGSQSFFFSVGAITFPVTVGKCIGKTAVVLRTDTSQFYKWISFAYTLFSLKNWNILGADTHAFENTYRLPCQSENVETWSRIQKARG